MATGEKHNIVVLRDDAGETYLLDQQALQESRVPKERSGEVDKALKDNELDKVTGGSYTLVGSYSLQHSGALSIAQKLRAI
jgi:hypothetical protein